MLASLPAASSHQYASFGIDFPWGDRVRKALMVLSQSHNVRVQNANPWVFRD
jgi:hypothetical protein